MIIDTNNNLNINRFINDVSLLKNQGLTDKEATTLIDFINKNYSTWIKDNESKSIYIKSDKASHSGGAIEYLQKDQRVFVHIRGIVDQGKRIKTIGDVKERGLCTIGGNGKIANSILLRSSDPSLLPATMYVQKKPILKEILCSGNVIKNTCSYIDYHKKEMWVAAEVQKILDGSKNLLSIENSSRGIISLKMNQGDLTDYIANHTLSESDYEFIVRATLNGLNELHKNNLIHRDIKPGNILVNFTNEGKLEIKIIDFDSVVKYGSVEEWVGTPDYISPNRYIALINEGKCITVDDLFSAGLTFFGIGTMIYRLL